MITHRSRWMIAAVLVLAPARLACAHSFEPALLDLHEQGPGVFDVRWQQSSVQAAMQQAAAQGNDLTPQLPAHCRRQKSGRSAAAGVEAATFWRVDCGPDGLRGADLTVAGIEGSRVDAIVRITWRDGEVLTGALHSGAPVLAVPPAPAARDAVTSEPAHTVLSMYFLLGLEHIVLGFDHLLFVFGLLLLVRTWSMLVKTITAFTLAHSLTLAAAVLGLVHMPPALVETMVAVGIVLLALELTRAPDAPPTLARQHPWLVALVFGLLHGLGFAGALAQAGLPAGQVALALVAFNLGIEVGQIAFVGAAIAPVAIVRRSHWASVRLLPAYAMGALAAAWTLERIPGIWTS